MIEGMAQSAIILLHAAEMSKKDVVLLSERCQVISLLLLKIVYADNDLSKSTLLMTFIISLNTESLFPNIIWLHFIVFIEMSLKKVKIVHIGVGEKCHMTILSDME